MGFDKPGNKLKNLNFLPKENLSSIIQENLYVIFQVHYDILVNMYYSDIIIQQIRIRTCDRFSRKSNYFFAERPLCGCILYSF